MSINAKNADFNRRSQYFSGEKLLTMLLSVKRLDFCDSLHNSLTGCCLVESYATKVFSEADANLGSFRY